MRIKIGDRWYSAAKGDAIAIELTKQDRENIGRMAESCTRYACFSPDDDRSPADMLAWIAADGDTQACASIEFPASAG